MVTAFDVATRLRELIGRNLTGYQLQKLLYYCQGWHVTWNQEPLFGEAVEAWDKGPVVADVWHAGKRGPWPQTSPLDRLEERTVNYVVARYGEMSGKELVDLTHDERPWSQARKLGRNTPIGLEALAEYFGEDDAADQAWFWTEEWQAGEREADEDATAGRGTLHLSAEDFFASL